MPVIEKTPNSANPDLSACLAGGVGLIAQKPIALKRYAEKPSLSPRVERKKVRNSCRWQQFPH